MLLAGACLDHEREGSIKRKRIILTRSIAGEKKSWPTSSEPAETIDGETDGSGEGGRDPPATAAAAPVCAQGAFGAAAGSAASTSSATSATLAVGLLLLLVVLLLPETGGFGLRHQAPVLKDQVRQPYSCFSGAADDYEDED